MLKWLLLALILATTVFWGRRLSAQTAVVSGTDRIKAARRNAQAQIQDRFKAARIAYPPRAIFLRAFKREALLELWVRGDKGSFKLVATYPVLASSGLPGPKRRQGDLQVPEGFYFINRFNPESAFHLSLGINYPNAADLLEADPAAPGGDIFIHGNKVTVGCLPLGDPAIEELFIIAIDTQKHAPGKIAVHIFPARMDHPDWPAFAEKEIARDPALESFWKRLRPTYDYFQRNHRLQGSSNQ